MTHMILLIKTPDNPTGLDPTWVEQAFEKHKKPSKYKVTVIKGTF